MRHDDTTDGTYFRSSERIFRMNEHWYFAAREGDQGPFVSEQDARKQAARFIEEKTQLANFEKKRLHKRQAHQSVLAGAQPGALSLADDIPHNPIAGGRKPSPPRYPAASRSTASDRHEPLAPVRELMI